MAKEERGIPVAVRWWRESIWGGAGEWAEGLGPRGGVKALSKRVTSPNFMLSNISPAAVFLSFTTKPRGLARLLAQNVC